MDTIKEKLSIRYFDVYNEWEKGNTESENFESERKEFNIDHMFQTLRCKLLHIYAYYDKWDAIKFLLEKLANVNIINEDRETPLHLAALFCSVDGVRVLL